MKISRRTMLASLGGALVTAAALDGKASDSPVANVSNLLAEWSNYKEEWHATICQQCPGGCGILVRVVDGNVTKIVGNPLYPVNHGGICMKGLAGVQVLYDPDRIRTPLARDGRRGEGKWKPISWDAALDVVTTRLSTLRKKGSAHTVAMLGGQYKGLTDQLFERFWTAYGTPNYIRYRCMEQEKASPSAHYMHGLDKPLCYDIANSRYILAFGCNLLETWLSTVHQLWAYGRFRQSPKRERAQFVYVDTRYSVTSAKADQWIPINPGTDGAFALGLAYIIIQESLYDRNYVQEMTHGFDDWRDSQGVAHTGFRTMVLEEYAPKKVSSITGIPVEKIFQVARSFAANRPAIAIGERGPPFHPNDLYTRMAIHALNALVGSIGSKGGIYRQGEVPLTSWEEIKGDHDSRIGLSHSRIDNAWNVEALFAHDDLQQLPQNIIKGVPYNIDTLFLYYTNPLFSSPNRDEWLAALNKVPFVVSFSPFMDETTLNADLVLPDSTYLERWRDDQVTYLAGITSFGIGKPVIAPILATRQTEDVLLDLAHRHGKYMKSALPWSSYKDVLYHKAEGLYRSRRGHIVMNPQDEAFEGIFLRQGFWRSKYSSYEKFWAELVEKGGWWDPNDSYVGPRQLFKTLSKKFEFYSQLLKKDYLLLARQMAPHNSGGTEAGLNRVAESMHLRVRGDDLFVPHFEEGANESSPLDYPLRLNTYKLMSHAGGRGANQPWLQEQPAVHVTGGWEDWVEINPATAAEHGIVDGDWVWLVSSKGKIKVRAKIYPGAMPRVLNMAFGQGHLAYGRWAKGRGENANDIIPSSFDPMRKLPIWGSARVRLIRA